MIGAIKLILNDIMSTFLETVQLEISQLVEILIRKLLTVLYRYGRRWKQTVQGFFQGRLAGGKKSFFEPVCKAKLKTGTEKKKKILKSLSVLKEDCQAFGLLGNKVEKLAEAFKYPMYL